MQTLTFCSKFPSCCWFYTPYGLSNPHILMVYQILIFRSHKLYYGSFQNQPLNNLMATIFNDRFSMRAEISKYYEDRALLLAFENNSSNQIVRRIYTASISTPT
jgi:hypothetical protein